MRIYDSIEENKDEIILEIESGAVFIYPTDTIYGIGCNALDASAVNKIRKLKKRKESPFSVIAPSKEWIYGNCIVEKKHEKHLKKLPGKYTLIFKLKNKNAVSREVNNSSGTIGVRIPKHKISDLVKELRFPIVTTSANLTGERPLTNPKKTGRKIQKNIDFAIYEGELKGKPSKVIDLVSGKTLRN